MKKNLLLTLALCLLAQWSVAQAPKWVEKAKRAVFSVVTYDEPGLDLTVLLPQFFPQGCQLL